VCLTLTPDPVVPEAKSAGDASHNFAPGDLVEVCEGELMHLQGKVLRIDGEKVTMLPKHKDLNVSKLSCTLSGHVFLL